MSKLREHLSDWGPVYFLLICTVPILACLAWQIFFHTGYSGTSCPRG